MCRGVKDKWFELDEVDRERKGSKVPGGAIQEKDKARAALRFGEVEGFMARREKGEREDSGINLNTL